MARGIKVRHINIKGNFGVRESSCLYQFQKSRRTLTNSMYIYYLNKSSYPQWLKKGHLSVSSKLTWAFQFFCSGSRLNRVTLKPFSQATSSRSNPTGIPRCPKVWWDIKSLQSVLGLPQVFTQMDMSRIPPQEGIWNVQNSSTCSWRSSSYTPRKSKLRIGISDYWLLSALGIGHDSCQRLMPIFHPQKTSPY